jgi:hypothetical protein
MKNWHERIQEAEERGGFTGGDYDLANSWTTCACGEQDPRIPRYGCAALPEETEEMMMEAGSRISPNAPKDMELSNLGIQFTDAVLNDDTDLARDLIQRIEVRAIQVLAELGYK